ncbi:Shikimate dehydrogenase [Pirellula sp. SH-Sr6A]|uniref:shikimate dehydrogenase n=1 Tax=Pirellula sp. SH-Sr6A TaxID=1632865 RepID=UPI00078EC9C8|nr:shikimate dehydrogenase [Pirellula sp. SH-Sr6A]AMV33639.1 Shikimate dehydrogenase [Pirellula sp. SH-Sr6A]
MLCVTIARTRHKHTIQEHQQVAELGAKLAELRLDYIGRSIDLGRLLKNRPTPVVVTCRRKEDGGRWDRTEEERLMLLRSAIAMGIEYVDLEEDTAIKIPRYGKTKRIVSLHNFEGTPDDLESIHERLAKADADIVKIAVQANSFGDMVKVLELMRNAKVPTIGIAMGDYGTPSRILATRYGAPFTYCVFNSERKVAPGQLSFDQMTNVYRAESIQATTRLFGVVADPVAHSYSPLIHNASFLAHDLDCRYLPFRVASGELPEFLKWCCRENIGGLSVTIPHKQAILPLLTQAESASQGIGACNTVVFAGEEMVGYNTDYRAAMDCLTEAYSKMTGKEDPFERASVLLLGSGGVSRAIGYGLAQRRALVTVTARNPETAKELAGVVNGKTIPWNERHSIAPDILVNGTPVGMFPDMDETPFQTSKLKGKTLVFDTIYNPEQTLFIKGARTAMCPVITGLQMFVRQAAYQYRLFTGKEPPIDVMVKTIKKAISPVNYKDLDEDDDTEDGDDEA